MSFYSRECPIDRMDESMISQMKYCVEIHTPLRRQLQDGPQDRSGQKLEESVDNSPVQQDLQEETGRIARDRSYPHSNEPLLDVMKRNSSEVMVLRKQLKQGQKLRERATKKLLKLRQEKERLKKQVLGLKRQMKLMIKQEQVKSHMFRCMKQINKRWNDFNYKDNELSNLNQRVDSLLVENRQLIQGKTAKDSQINQLNMEVYQLKQQNKNLITTTECKQMMAPFKKNINKLEEENKLLKVSQLEAQARIKHLQANVQDFPLKRQIADSEMQDIRLKHLLQEMKQKIERFSQYFDYILNFQGQIFRKLDHALEADERAPGQIKKILATKEDYLNRIQQILRNEAVRYERMPSRSSYQENNSNEISGQSNQKRNALEIRGSEKLNRPKPKKQQNVFKSFGNAHNQENEGTSPSLRTISLNGSISQRFSSSNSPLALVDTNVQTISHKKEQKQ